MRKTCPYCSVEAIQGSPLEFPIKKAGWYYRRSDRKAVQRYKCKVCENYFSSSTLGFFCGQKKRHLNYQIEKQLAAAVSLRETARILQINRKTVARKLRIQGHLAKLHLNTLNLKKPKATVIQFDDMETFEHTKCKPVAISLAVEESTRRILDFQICAQPAKGLLAKKSVLKYGKRPDERPIYRLRLFQNLKNLVTESVLIKTDQSTHYIKNIKQVFPKSVHIAYKGRKGCVVGQGELKAGGFDPLFSLNHTAAMARYKISRLVRKTWCTTKSIEQLKNHFAIMALQHNHRLDLKNKLTPLRDAI